MRYLVMIKATPEYEAGQAPNPQLAEAMGKIAMEAMRTGKLLGTEGLLPSSQGTRIKYSGGQRTVTDGPFTEAKELIGGFALLRVDSKAEAIEMANQVLEAHVQAGVEEVNIELRPLFDPPDIP